MNENRISQLESILNELVITAGDRENTKIYPNAEVINASPADLPAGYIIVKAETGYYIPAVKVPGLTVSDGDFVNLMYIKGTEPIAFQHGSSSSVVVSGGGWPYDDIITVDPTNANADYDNLPDAITAAMDGQTILFDGEHNLASSLTLNKNITIQGVNPETSIITSTTQGTTVSCTAASTIRNLSIKNESSASTPIAILCNGATLHLEGVKVRCLQAAAGGNYGINTITSPSTITMKNCDIQCANSSVGVGGDRAISIEVSGDVVTVDSSRLNGATYDLATAAGVTVNLIDPVLVNGLGLNFGTIRGMAYDGNGRKLRVKPAGIAEVRLTLASGTPVTTTDQMSKTTLYATPYGGGRIEIYNGSFWVEWEFVELSVSVPATVNRLFDVFVYDNAGTLTLETVNWNQSTGSITGATNATPIVVTSSSHGLSNGDMVIVSGVGGNTAANGRWSVANVTTNTFELNGSQGNGAYTSGGTWYKMNSSRATALALQDGRYVKSGATERLYLGTGCTTASSGQTEESDARGFLWNYYNRVVRRIRYTEATGHAYSTASWRKWRNIDAVIDQVIGVYEERIMISQITNVSAVTSGSWFSGTGQNNVVVVDAAVTSTVAGRLATTIDKTVQENAGYHFYSASEYANNSTFSDTRVVVVYKG